MILDKSQNVAIWQKFVNLQNSWLFKKVDKNMLFATKLRKISNLAKLVILRQICYFLSKSCSFMRIFENSWFYGKWLYRKSETELYAKMLVAKKLIRSYSILYIYTNVLIFVTQAYRDKVAANIFHFKIKSRLHKVPGFVFINTSF